MSHLKDAVRFTVIGAALLLGAVSTLAQGGSLQTTHFSKDAAAFAAVQSAGGAFRFAGEARSPTKASWEIALRRLPQVLNDSTLTTANFDSWPNGSPVSFRLVFDATTRRVSLTLTRGTATATVSTKQSHDVVGDFNELFVRAAAVKKKTRIVVKDLVLDGVTVGDQAAADRDFSKDGGGDDDDDEDEGTVDVLRIRGGQLSDGFVLTGSITLTSVPAFNKNTELDAQLWGAMVPQGPPADTTPPTVAITAPAEGSLSATAKPPLTATYADAGSGVDTASVRLMVDGADRTAEAQVTATGLAWTSATPLGEGAHSATVTVRDVAANSASATRGFTTDTVAPALAITTPAAAEVQDDPRPPITLTFADTTSGVAPPTLHVFIGSTELTAGCTVGAAQATCLPPPLAAGAHSISADLRDRAGNLATAGRDFQLSFDQEGPAVTITAPEGPLVTGDATPALAVAYADPSGVDTASLRVRVDGVDVSSSCTTGPGSATCVSSPLGRGMHAMSAEIRDLRGNLGAAGKEFAALFPLAVSILEPADGSILSVPVVRIAGTVPAGAQSVRVNGVPAQLTAGGFVIESFGLHDGVNNLVAVAEDAAGNVGTAAIRVTADTTKPAVSITFPANEALTADSSTRVTGLVNDLTIGTVSDGDVVVTVNGIAATVSQRSFLATGVPLAPGRNTLVATATDRAGNHSSATIAMTRREASGASIRVASGDGQTAEILTPLPAPLVARVSDAAGQPIAGKQVVFRVAQGSGVLDLGERAVIATTNAQGEASVHWTLGNRSGVSVNRVRATAVGVAGEVSLLAAALSGPPAALNVASGNNQRGAVGGELSQPLFVVVTDAGDNPLPGVPVTFRAVEGGGRFAGEESVVVQTDASGQAETRFTLGPAAGLDSNRVEATFEGLTTEAAVFQASALLPGAPADTRITGVVLDNQGDPVPGVTLRLRESALTTVADAQGQFHLAGVPLGQVFLIADASTAARPGSWASLEFELFTVPGAENTLPRPIYILPLDLGQGLSVDEIRGGTVRIADVPGFALEVAPGSVTFPGGSRSGVVSVTAVHADKVPMAPGAGMQPRLIVTIQPLGAHFDPPAPLTLPNVDSLPPGRVTEMFSFDHDIGAFVAVGTGTVSEDGQVVRSDPGFGIVEAGWHCGSPPSGSGAGASLSVKLSPKPIKIQYGKTTTVTAQGKPPRDGEYQNWTVTGSNVDSMLDFTSQPSCPDQPSCTNTLKSTELVLPASGAKKVCGTAQAKVTFRCKTTGKTVTDTATIEQGCAGKDAAACKSICATVPAQGMCGTPCSLTGTSHPGFNAGIGGLCWRVKVGGAWTCYWDHNAPGGTGFVNLCCPNRCFGPSFNVWGQGPGDYVCTVIESCTDPSFGGLDPDGDPGVNCAKIR